MSSPHKRTAVAPALLAVIGRAARLVSDLIVWLCLCFTWNKSHELFFFVH